MVLTRFPRNRKWIEHLIIDYVLYDSIYEPSNDLTSSNRLGSLYYLFKGFHLHDFFHSHGGWCGQDLSYSSDSCFRYVFLKCKYVLCPKPFCLLIVGSSQTDYLSYRTYMYFYSYKIKENKRHWKWTIEVINFTRSLASSFA